MPPTPLSLHFPGGCTCRCVLELPETYSGKYMRALLRALAAGDPSPSLGALSNPTCLGPIRAALAKPEHPSAPPVLPEQGMRKRRDNGGHGGDDGSSSEDAVESGSSGDGDSNSGSSDDDDSDGMTAENRSADGPRRRSPRLRSRSSQQQQQQQRQQRQHTLYSELVDGILRLAHQLTGQLEIGPSTPLMNGGLDSISSTHFVDALQVC